MSDGDVFRRLGSNGVALAYRELGSGGETVVFSHSYLVDSRQFDAQIDVLAQSYRVIAFDHRDHGASGRSSTPYTLDDLVADGVRVIEELDAAPCHWVGLSTGGFVGMRIALRRPSLLRTVTLMDTSATSEELYPRLKGRAMLGMLRLVGVKPLMGQAMKLMFGGPFLKGEEFSAQRQLWYERMANNDPAALVRFGNAISARDDVLDDLRGVDVPVHVICGTEDRGLPAKHSEAIADAVPGAKLSLIPGAGHLCTIERPVEVNGVLVPFIESHSSSN